MLVPTGWWAGSGLRANKLEGGFHNGASANVLVGEQAPHMAAASPLVSKVSSSCLLPLWEERSEGGLAQGSFKLLPLSGVLDYVKFCVSPLRVESLFSVLWVSQK